MTRALLAAAALALLSALSLGAGARAAADRLARWYDDREGLDAPCPLEPRRAYRSPDGFVIELPACWSIETRRHHGREVHTLRDPGRGLGEAVVTEHRKTDDAEAWSALAAELDRQIADGATVAPRRGGQRVIRRQHTPGPRGRHRVFESHHVDDAGALSVRYRVAKVFSASPSVGAVRATLTAAVESAVRSRAMRDRQDRQGEEP